MEIISSSDCIKCSSGSSNGIKSVTGLNNTEVYYADTVTLKPYHQALNNILTIEERQRAGQFHFDADRQTYITSHAILRLVIAKKLNTNPLSISFYKGKHNKPGLEGNPLFFNLAHTRNAFAIAISMDCPVGIDLEEINQKMDYQSIIKKYFSNREYDFILNSGDATEESFFLLWTRKEALLKAFGTGITDNLIRIEVSEPENFIDRKFLNNSSSDNEIPDHYIYSKKTGKNYMSIASPCKAEIGCYYLNTEIVDQYILKNN